MRRTKLTKWRKTHPLFSNIPDAVIMLQQARTDDGELIGVDEGLAQRTLCLVLGLGGRTERSDAELARRYGEVEWVSRLGDESEGNLGAQGWDKVTGDPIRARFQGVRLDER